MLVEVPDGWSAPDGATTVQGSDIAGVDDGTYMKVEVSNADIASGNGTVTLSVDLTPPEDTTGAVSLDVYAGAQETTTSGVEASTDNNIVYTGASTSADFGQPDLFTSGNDTVDFDDILPGSYSVSSFDDALGGDDVITLADDMSGFGFDGDDFFNAGSGDDSIIGGTGR